MWYAWKCGTPDKTNNNHGNSGTPNNAILSILLLQKDHGYHFNNVYPGDLSCAVAEKGLFANVTETD